MKPVSSSWRRWEGWERGSGVPSGALPMKSLGWLNSSPGKPKSWQAALSIKSPSLGLGGCPFRRSPVGHCMFLFFRISPRLWSNLFLTLPSNTWFGDEVSRRDTDGINELISCREVQEHNRRKGERGSSRAVIVNPDYVAKILILSIQLNKHASCFSIYKMEIIIVIYLLGFLYRLS